MSSFFKSANRVLFSMIFIFNYSINCSAWGSNGHRLVAEIAFKLIDARTRANVISSLGGFTIEQASTWMDDQRSNSAYDEMKPWHYIEYKEGEESSMAKTPNIATKLNESVELLKNKKNVSAFQVQQALLYIFHLVGDISQPLHCGYKIDAGGNTEKVDCYGLKWPISLHRVWDNEIIYKSKVNLESCMTEVASIQKQYLKNNTIFDPYVWATDSRMLLPAVYDYQDNTITETYLTKNTQTVKTQLAKAGIRLAKILTTYFK